MTAPVKIPFDNSFARLPERFYARLAPTPVAAPELIRVNESLAQQLGIDAAWLASSDGVATLAGNAVPAGSAPLASAYAGHQFGSWNPQLGDGRAILLGELVDKQGERYDWQLKGAGPTPWSRGGDGRSPLGPVLREYIVSEAMATLGIPTTRALAAVTTGELVFRDQALPGAILARVARSHIRVGTFQYFSARGDREALQLLVAHVAERHFPEAADAEQPALALLDAVVSAQAELVASWQLVGFIHGVMNTDNMLLCGDTVDYGPCAFMDTFDPDTVYSSIDHGGRYAYRNQPGIAQWNLACLAQALLPLLAEEPEQAAALAQPLIDAFQERFLTAHAQGMGRKLGLSRVTEEDELLFRDLLQLMQEQQTDFTLTFRVLSDRVATGSPQALGDLYELPPAFDGWIQRWLERLQGDTGDTTDRQARMYAANPVFIPRNHLVQEVITAAEQGQDYEPFNALAEVLSRPTRYAPEFSRYALPPAPGEVVTQTFCGT
jgi:uncharacterized protein YdiU (UPF0061 family)